MPTNEHTRSEYLQALLNQKKTIQSNGSLLNPSVQQSTDSNNFGTQALVETNLEGTSATGSSIAEFDVEKAKESAGTGNWFLDGINKIFGFVDEIAAKFGAGFVGAFEGILDLGATAIGALGDATGWYSSDPFTKWAQQDIGTALAEWTKTYANFTPWGIVSNIANGNFANGDYWNDALSGAKDILGVAFFADNELDKNYRDDADKYYSMNDELESGFGQFLGNAAYSIGFMLPSIMTGGASAAAGASSVVAKGLSLASMGLSASGKGSETALNEGASAGQALGYGVASGAVEVASEIVVGKMLGKAAKALKLDNLAKGFGKVNGVSFSKELVGKASAKELAATMFEEGAEEVFSDILSPFCESIYKGSDAFKRFGEEEFYKEMGYSFASGAFVGGLSGAVQTTSNYKKYGKTGVAVMQNNAEIIDLKQQYTEAKINGTDTTEIESQLKVVMEDTLNQFEEMSSDKTKVGNQHFENLIKAYMGKVETKGMTQEQIQSINVQRVTAFKESLTEPAYKSMTNDLNRVFKQTGLSTEIQWATEEEMKAKNFTKQGLTNAYVDTDGNVRGFYEKSSGKIIINEKYASEVGEIIKHEGISHAIIDTNDTVKNNIISYIEADSKLSKQFHEYDEELVKQYGKDKATLESERLATFLETQLQDYKSFSKLFSNNKLTKHKLVSLLNRIKSKLNNTKGLDNKLVKNIDRAIKELQVAQGNETTNGQPQVAYSKGVKPTNKSSNAKFATIAPFYSLNADTTNIWDNVRLADKQFYYLERGRTLMENLNIKPSGLDTQLGSWQGVGELSYQFNFDTSMNSKAIERFAYLQSDIVGEVQNAVILGEYLSLNSNNYSSFEHTFEVLDINGVNELLLKVGIDSNTIKINNNKVQLFVERGDTASVYKIRNALQELKNKNNYKDGSYEKTKCNARFANRFDRYLAEREWAKTSEVDRPIWDEIRSIEYEKAARNVQKSLDGEINSLKSIGEWNKWLTDSYIAIDNEQAISYKNDYLKRKGVKSFEELHNPKHDIKTMSNVYDNLGRRLNLNQKEFNYYKENGKVMALYHGTTETNEFFVFDKDTQGKNTYGEKAFFFSNNQYAADQFSYEVENGGSSFTVIRTGKKGYVKDYYLQLTNPLNFNNLNNEELDKIAWDYANKQHLTRKGEETNKWDNGYTDEEIVTERLKLHDSVIEDYKKYKQFNNIQAFKQIYIPEIETIKSWGYDGFICDMYAGYEIEKTPELKGAIEYAVFEPSQIKSTDNLNPHTNNDDIRFSKPVKGTSATTKDTTFKAMKETKDIVNVTKTYIEAKLGKEYQVKLPKDFNDFSSKQFGNINGVKNIDLQSKKVTEAFLNTNIEALNEDTGKFEHVNTLDKMLNPKEKADLQEVVKSIITSAPDTEARSKVTKSLEMTLDRVADIAREYGDRLNNIRIVTNYRNKYRQQINRNYQITDDNITKDGLTFLYKAFAEMHGSNKGFNKNNVANNVNEILGWYNEKTITPENYPNLPYEEELREKLIDFRDSLGEPVTRQITLADGTTKDRVIFGSLSAHSLQLAKECMQMIEHVNRQSLTQYISSVMPSVNQSFDVINTMSYGQRVNKIAELFRSYKRGFSPSYAVLKEILGGNTVIANTLTTDIQVAENLKKLYIGAYHDEINKKLKEFSIKSSLDKTFDLNGNKFSYDQGMALYISLNVEANFNAINESGIQFYDETNRLKTIAEKGHAEELKSQIDKALPDSYKKMADWLLSTMNDSVKAEYIKWYEERFGKYNHRNEIGDIKQNTYWMLNRSYQMLSNIEKAVSNPQGVFKHAKTRKGSNNRVLLGGALSGFDAYIQALSKETYIKPVYRKALSILNTKNSNGTSIYQLLETKVNSKDISYLERTMEDILGAYKSNTNELLNGIVSRFSVAKLSLNVGTMLKQFASIWTSNIPMRQSTKAVISRIFSNETIKAEYKTLVEELGGLKYRESSAGVIRANADGLHGKAEWIAEKGMIGISKVDLFTVGTGVYALMIIGQDQFNYKIGTQENIDFVKEHWTDFELSQIGNDALSKNAVARGDYGSLIKGIFGFMQGANRAALGSQINKYDLWQRNHKLDKATLEANKTSANQAVNEFIDSHKVEGEFHEYDLTEEERNEFIDLKTKQIDADTKLKDYIKYEVAGGKFIPTNMVAGLIAQGLFVGLITELMKHIKGKKDWDDWDLLDLGGDILLAIGVDWIPMVNAISSMIKGYEVSIPALDVINQVVDIINSGKSGDWKTVIRQIAILLGDSTGIPVETLYQYIYGMVNAFSPETAYEMKNVLYGTSNQSATKTLNNYVENGNSGKAYQMVSIIMDKYKMDGASDRTKQEITNLYMSGYNAMPKSYMTEYTNENGESVSLNESQITQFKQIYSQSDKAVRDLMQVTDYSSYTQEEKANLIKKIYDYYYSYAKAKVLGTSADSKIANLLLNTSGNINIANYVAVLNKVKSITDSKTKTRKELVVEYINSQRTLTRNEKLLVMYLAGYSTGDTNKNTLVNYLTSLGMSKSTAKEFLGIETKK